MRRTLTIIGLQLYAVLLAVYQWHIGVRTDEAKYLLNIPYPHPPLARSILSAIDGWQYQEIFWRIIFATLVVQSVWLIVDLLRVAKLSVRYAAALCWLLSTAVILQAGTVMMAVLTALQASVFVWLLLRDREPIGRDYLIALFWLASLFTAYQAALCAPLVWMVLGRAKTSYIKRAMLVGVPLLLLALYTVSNPLAAASFVHLTGASPTLNDRLLGFFSLWAIGGGIILSLIGTFGLLRYPTISLTGTFLLLCAYVFLSPADYYAILFTPLFIAGLMMLLRKSTHAFQMTGWLMPLGLAASLWFVALPPTSTARSVADMLGKRDGDVLIHGNFGHDWQYELSQPVLRYRADRLDDAGVVICLAACEEMSRQTGWGRLEDAPVEVWVRSAQD